MSSRHTHPTLARPTTQRQFLRELAWVWRRGIGSGYLSRTMSYEVLFPERLSRIHQRRARRYAQCVPGHKTLFEFAPEILWLPKPHRIGLIAHEVGHVIAGGGSESAADMAAEECLGILIGYDLRWPTNGNRRGLQFAHQIY